MMVFSEDSKIKITWGAVVFILGLVFGFAAWMTSLDLSANENSKSIINIEDNYSGVQNALNSIDKRLSRIEILLEQETRGKK